MTSLILTILGPDRPGLVETISTVVEKQGGNWLESRMAKLSGHFAGILQVEVSPENRATLEKELAALSEQGIQISVASDTSPSESQGQQVSLEIIGNDRPGIVKRITSTLAAQEANVLELKTSLESAPMAGHPLFHTEGSVSLPDGKDLSELILALENLGPDLSVTVN